MCGAPVTIRGTVTRYFVPLKDDYLHETTAKLETIRELINAELANRQRVEKEGSDAQL